jgi:tripartite-type tricarboxylate transporter receptor subunit TctC
MRTFFDFVTKPLLHKLVSAWVVVACATGAFAQQAATPGGSPSQTVKLVVGYAPGGPVDSAARLVAPFLAKELDQTVVIDNRPGAGGATGGDAVAKSAPNGLLLFFAASPTITITPHVLKAMPFDTLKDLTAIAPMVSYVNVLAVNKEQPFKTIPELITYAKANPGKVSYGSAGMGASNHLSGELFALRTGTLLTHVPYKGSAPAMTDVIGGQISMMFDIISTSRNYLSAGRIRVLAVTSKDRNPAMPDVPSLHELGITDYDVSGWFGLFGPPKMPAELVARLNQAVRKALAQDELKKKLVEQGFDIWTGSAALLADRAGKEFGLWGGVTKGMVLQ